MMKTKIALAALLACFALTPAVAAPAKSGKAKATRKRVSAKVTSTRKRRD